MRTYSRSVSSLYVSRTSKRSPVFPVTWLRLYSSSHENWNPIIGGLPLDDNAFSARTEGENVRILIAAHPAHFVTTEFATKHRLEMEDISSGCRVKKKDEDEGELITRAAWVPLILNDKKKKSSQTISLYCLAVPARYLNNIIPGTTEVDMVLGIAELHHMEAVLDYGERSLVITVVGLLRPQKFKLQWVGQSSPFQVTKLN